jgi:NADH-quinone oxidoreductase subunit N
MLAVIALALAVSLVSINHFILLFLSLEGLSLTLYVMAAIGKQVGGTTAATQYFIFGSLGSILLLLGLVILYERFGVMSISSWLLATSSGSQTGTLFIPYAMGSGLISSGLLLKFGAAPLHSWVVEVYGNLPYYLM